jgi:hypothetical protein
MHSGVLLLWEILLSNSKDAVCIYNSCENCECQCARKAENALKRFRISYFSVDKTHSLTYRFTNPDDALMAYEALKWAGIRKARIVFPV